MKKKWVLHHCDLDLWPKVTKFNRVRVSAGRNHLAKTVSKSVHPFGWNFVHKKCRTHGQRHRHTHTQTNCSENITPPWFHGGVKSKAVVLWASTIMRLTWGLSCFGSLPKDRVGTRSRKYGYSSTWTFQFWIRTCNPPVTILKLNWLSYRRSPRKQRVGLNKDDLGHTAEVKKVVRLAIKERGHWEESSSTIESCMVEMFAVYSLTLKIGWSQRHPCYHCLWWP